MRLLFFGGSFDPVHHGHLIIARDALELKKFDKVIFIPSKLSPFKQEHIASELDRYIMLSFIKNSFFDIDDFELRSFDTPSYTYRTALYIKRKYKQIPIFLVGSDTFLSIHLWKNTDILFKNARFLVILRNDDSKEKIANYVKELRLKIDYDVMEGRKIDISSSEIRKRVKEGLSIEYLVPESVFRYIKRKGLYKSE